MSYPPLKLNDNADISIMEMDLSEKDSFNHANPNIVANIHKNGVVIKMEAESTTNDGQQQQQSTTKTALQMLIEKIKPSSYGQRRNYSSIDISAEKWLMAYDESSLAKLANPPSLADGIGSDLEKEVRYLGCELIQSGAILLKLSQTAAATGQILFQRFYYQKSFVRYNFEHMVMACLLLAGKIEEEPRKPRDVLNVYHRLKQLYQQSTKEGQQQPQNGLQSALKQRPKKFDHLELGGRQYLHTKNAVIKAERRLLNTLGFVVHVHHPHKLIYIYLHILGLLHRENDPNVTEEEVRESRELLQRAWSYMNDGLRTDMFLRYTPETIACACIQLAVKTVNRPIVLPKDPFPWFELFDASDRDVRAISQILIELYGRTKCPNLDWVLAQLEKQQQKIADSEKAKQDQELAEMKEAIKQRKSETAAVMGNTTATAKKITEVSIEKSRVEERRKIVAPASSKQAERERSPPRRERKEEKRRRSRSRDHDRRVGKERERDKRRPSRESKRSRSRDEKHRKRRSRSRSPIQSTASMDLTRREKRAADGTRYHRDRK